MYDQFNTCNKPTLLGRLNIIIPNTLSRQVICLEPQLAPQSL